jgi:hypothetical protein
MVPSPLLTEEHVTAPPIARGVSPSSTPRRTPASDAKKKKKSRTIPVAWMCQLSVAYAVEDPRY